MQVNPYLNFNGQCKEAFEFYARCFEGEIESIFTHGETPASEHVPPDWQDAVMHARLVFGDNVLLGSDAPGDMYRKPQGLAVSLQVPDTAEAERLYHALVEGGSAEMPIQETFWALRFAMLTDRFGIPWMINCARPE